MTCSSRVCPAATLQELFKELEKSLKLKPFAQATLGQQQEQSAEERAKEESEQWLRRVKDQLTEQIELIEVRQHEAWELLRWCFCSIFRLPCTSILADQAG